MPQKCLDCNKVILPNDDTGLSATACKYCGSTKLVCDHPSGHFDPIKGCFVCGTCGHEYRSGVKQLRKLAEGNNSLSKLAKLLDIQ